MGPNDIIFYDRAGTPIAYILNEVGAIYSYGGRAVGYLEEDGIFSYQGRFLGWMLNGWVMDFDGTQVFFTKDSVGGPAKPIRGIQPMRGTRQYCPGRGFKDSKSLKPIPSLFWSARSGEQFFGQVSVVIQRMEPRAAEVEVGEEGKEREIEANASTGQAPATEPETEAGGL